MPDLTPGEWQAILLSLKVGVWSMIVGVPLALALAWMLARCRFPGKALIDGLIHMPLVMPPVVTGYLLLLVLGRNGLIGGWLEQQFGIVFAFRWTGAVVAAMIMALPLMVRPIRLSIEAIDQRLESAAATLGAHPLRVFATITLPLALPGLLTGTILGFARSLGEFGATITFVSNIPGQTQTLPLAIYTQIQIPSGEAAALRLTIIAVMISFLALLGAEYFSRRLQRRFES